MPEKILLQAEALSAIRGERVLFRAVDICARAGDLVLIRGVNGSGKTTLLRQLAGLSQPASGQVSDAARHHWLGHEMGLKVHETPYNHLQHWARVWGSQRDLTDILTTYGLTRSADIPVRYLSAGQKRRTALARLALDTRALWLLDEPLTALDSEGQNLFCGLMRDHCAAGGAIVAAVHGDFRLTAQKEVRI